MTNRRRSERYRVALPVLIKDAQGGEQTKTVDLSAHGITVLASKPRNLRQYVELELTLLPPSPKIRLTSVVARFAEALETAEGAQGKGLGLEFFLFDAEAKAEWHRFVARLRSAPQPPKSATDAGAPPRAAAEDEALEEDEGPPTFIVKPRDLGRLWAFFRGELSKGLVRLEAPVALGMGEVVELLVVHPGSRAEWALPGQVARALPQGRSGRPMLEVRLTGLDEARRAAFRAFIASGRLPDEGADPAEAPQVAAPPAPPAPAPPEGDDAEPTRGLALSRVPSITIDFEGLSRPSGVAPRPLPRAPSLDVRPDAAEPDQEPEAWMEPTEHAERARPSAAVEPSALEEEERPVYALGAGAILGAAPEVQGPPSAPTTGGEPTAILTPAHEGSPFEDSEETTGSFRAEAVPPPEAVRAPPDARTPTPTPAPQPEASPAATLSDRPFASFFAEAAASRAASRVEAHAAVGAAPPAAPSSRPAPSAIAVTRAKLDPKPRVRAPAGAASEPPPLPPAPPRAPPLPPPLPADALEEVEAVELVLGAPLSDGPVEGANPLPEVERRLVPPRPEVTVEPWFELVGVAEPLFRAPSESQVVPASRRPAAPQGPRGSIREASEDAVRGFHLDMSTESTNPNLDRDIALARARVVRSPNSATARLRLGALLARRGQRDRWQEAVEALSRAIELAPDHPAAHHALAEAHARRGEYEDAARHLARARSLGYRIDPALERAIDEGRRG